MSPDQEQLRLKMQMEEEEGKPQESAAPDFSPHGKAGAALRGFGQGEGYGFIDELRGVGGAASTIPGGKELLSAIPGITQGFAYSGHDVQRHPGEGPIDFAGRAYKSERDAARQEDATAEKEHPGIFTGSEIGGAVASPNPTSKASLLARLAGYFGQGALTGAGSSDAPTALGVAEDAASVGLPALALGSVGEAGLKLAEPIAAKGKAAAQALVDSKFGKAVAKQAGRLGGVTQEGSRDLEVLPREIGSVSPETQAKARAALESPDAAELREQVVGNKAEALPEHLQAVNRERAALNQMRDNAAGTKAEMLNDITKGTIATPLWNHGKRIAGRAIGAYVGGKIGSAVAPEGHEQEGAQMGELAGLMFGGKPVSSVKNLLKDPKFAYQAAELPATLLRGGEGFTKGVGAATQLPHTFAEWLAMHDEEKK